MRNAFLISACLMLSLLAYGSGLSKGKEASWVRIGTFDPSASAASKQLEDGYFFLLAEKQSNVAGKECYYRYTRKIVNDAGVQSCTRLSLDYNKSFEQVIIHSLNVIRDGKVMDRLDMSKFNVIQQQNDLAENQYNDEMTGILVLEDIRVNDILDISYTRIGYNPIFEDKYYDYISLGYSTPVAKIYNNIIIPDSRPLHLKYYNGAAEAKVSHENGNTRYSWSMDNVKPLKLEDGTPLGFDPYPGISITEYDTWLQVKRWAQSIYLPVLNTSSPEITKLAKEIQSKYADDNERVTAAVRYVQDKIRYFGIETGVNTHKPNVPSSTLHLGYGDCKDKSVLLCSILRAMGIEAHPILIRTFDPGGLSDHLPGPGAFDHVCVQAEVHGSTYYFDATSISQKADLAHLHFPNYKYGLVVTDSSTGLTPIAYTGGGARTAMHTRIQADDTAKPVRMVVSTTYTGLDADRFRNQWNTQSHEEIEKTYLNFYVREYPNIEAVEGIKIVEDDSLINMIRIEEVYTIDNFWVSDKSKVNEYTREFFAYNLNSILNRPKDKRRTMPLGISYPVHYEEEYEIVLPFDFTVKRQPQLIDNDAFVFTGSYSFSSGDNTLHLKYTYDTKADNLPADKAHGYFADLDKMTEQIDYSLLWNPHKVADAGFSFFIFFIFLVTLAGSVWAAYNLYLRYDPATPYTAGEGRSIGGWLILPAISITLQPLGLIYTFFTTHYFQENNVDIIFNKSASNYHPALGYTVIAEMILTVVLFVYAVFVLILFYQRRSSFPRLYIYYLIYLVVFEFMEAIVVDIFKVPDSTMAATFTRIFIYAIIWGLYMRNSVRVKETFVKTRHIASPSPPTDQTIEIAVAPPDNVMNGSV